MNPLLLKLVPYMLIGGAVFGLKHCYDSDIRNKAVADERGKVATAYRDTIKKSLDSVAKIRHIDTVRFTKTLIERVPVLKEVEKFIEKNIPVPVEVVKNLIQVDSNAIKACSAVVRSCGEENRLLKLDVKKTEDQRDAALSLQPSFGRQLSTHTIAVVMGAAACFFWCPREPK